MKTAIGMLALASTMMLACVGEPVEGTEDEFEMVEETEQAVIGTKMLHLKLDEGSGTTLTNSGSSNITAAFRTGGAYQWVAAGNANCIMGSCLHFDGTGNNVNGISTNLGLNALVSTGSNYNYARTTDSSMSFSAWVVLDSTQPSSNGSRHQILSGDNGDYDWSLLYVQNPGQTNYKLSFFRTGFYLETANILVPGVRYHVAVTFDTPTRTAKAYLNGVEMLSTNVMATNAVSNSGIMIGENPGGWNEPMKGYIDDVRVYASALTGAEVPVVACDDDDATTVDTFATNPTTGAGGCTHVVPNLLQNGSFETLSGGMPTNWQVTDYMGYHSFPATTTSSDASSGSVSMKIEHTYSCMHDPNCGQWFNGDWTTISQDVSGAGLVAGESYRLTFAYKTNSDDAFGFSFADPSTLMHATPAVSVASDDIINDSQWHTASYVFDMTQSMVDNIANGYEPRLALYWDYNTLGTIQIDNVILAQE